MSSETIKVKIEDQQAVDRILKKFKRLCESYGIVREYKKRQSYAKPSVCLKEKRKAADKRRKKTILKQRYSSDKI